MTMVSKSFHDDHYSVVIVPSLKDTPPGGIL
jgi:hypothetical protein